MNANVAAPPAVFKDRSTGLMVFGILLIILGAYLALMTPFMFFGQFMAGRVSGVEPMSPRLMLPAAGMYLCMAALFITLGIGSLRCRRWSRALVLIISWMWLIGGSAGLVGMCFMLPQMFSGAMPGVPPGTPPLPPVFRIIMIVFALGVGLVAYVIIPGVLVFFYRQPDVKATCALRDPQPRWTDACPLPVLAISLMLGCGALMMPLMVLAYHSLVPCFGRYLTGAPALLLLLVTALAYAWGARACYKLNRAGWWIALVGFTLWLSSAVVTFARIGILPMYEAMEMPKQQLEMMRQMKFLDGPWLWIAMLLAWVPFIGYIIYTKKYFKR